MGIEQGPQIPKTFSEVEQEMNQQGFTFAGKESLTKITFGPDAKFIAEPSQTKEDVLKKYQAGGQREVELIDEPNKTENQAGVWVFIKEK